MEKNEKKEDNLKVFFNGNVQQEWHLSPNQINRNTIEIIHNGVELIEELKEKLEESKKCFDDLYDESVKEKERLEKEITKLTKKEQR